MAKLPVVSWQRVARALTKAGFKPAPKRGKGSHLAFVKRTQNKTNLVIVPRKREIPRGTLLAIIGQSGLSKEEFIRLLE